MHITFGVDGHLWLNVIYHGANSQFPSMHAIDLTKHIEDCVRRVVQEELAKMSSKPCVFEHRPMDGSASGVPFGAGRAWCQTHGFDCPQLIGGA